MKRFAIVSLILFFSLPLAARQHAVARRGDVPQDPAGWLSARATILQSVEYPAPSSDLVSLSTLTAAAHIVGLADGTHSTHEFYTTKLRIIDFLVREMNYDVVAFEAPFPLFNRIDAYIQGAPGDPRALLAEANDRLGYRFWFVEEMLAVVEWMRAYNANRGDRPAVHMTGFDIYDGVGAAEDVVAYLRRADPADADSAEQSYACLSATSAAITVCRASAQSILDHLVSRGAELASVDYDFAIQNARIVVQSLEPGSLRDARMAANAQWLQRHRSATGRIILWGHSAHISKSDNVFIKGGMGVQLAAALGQSYVVIGSLTGSGTYLQWEPPTTGTKVVVRSLPEPSPGSFESSFHLGPAPALLVSLKGELPPFLTSQGTFTGAGTAAGSSITTGSLPSFFDAVVYIDRTTPTHWLGQQSQLALDPHRVIAIRSDHDMVRELDVA